VLFIAGALLLSTAGVYSQIGKTFMPTMDEGDIIVQVEKLPSINLEQSVRIDGQIQKAILDHVPEVERITARVGADEIGLDPMGLNETDTFMVLKPEAEWRMKGKEALIEEIRKVLETFPGIAYSFTQPIQMRVTEMLTGVRGDVAVKLYGPDLQELNAKAEEIAGVLRGIRGASDVFTLRNEGMQYLVVKVDRLAAGRLGLNADSLADTLRAQVEGRKLGIVQEGIRRTPLLLRGTGEPANISTLQIALPDGRRAPLSAVADIQTVEGVVSVSRERGQRFSVVRSNVEGRDLVGFVDDAKKAVAEKVSLPQGYFIQWGGHSGGAGADFPAAVLHLSVSPAGAAGAGECAAGADRRRLWYLAFGGIPVRVGLGGFHLPAWHCGAEWGSDGELFQPAPGARPADG
jgi:cobalt-zinc-cadmium resistance protein CzcA